MKKVRDKIRKSVLLAPYTTFKIGGCARYFFEANKLDDIKKAVQFAQEQELPFFILGHGSNALFSDKGFSGLVIKNNCQAFKIDKDTIYAEAGMSLNELLNISLENNLSGLEWSAGIPGTLGGAIYGNAGAYDQQIADSILEVECLDGNLLKKRYQNPNINFQYRESIFKKTKDIILAARLKLNKQKPNIEKVRQILKQKKEKQPLSLPSAGCIFKNPKPQIAAKLIEQCNLKGKQIGQAQVSEKHANFIINLGSAKAADVVKLIMLIKKEVKSKFKISLEEEIQII